MASFGPRGSKVDPDLESDRFREMRERMNKERDAFFQDSPNSFFGRESPFFRVSPSLQSDFCHYHPRFVETFFDLLFKVCDDLIKSNFGAQAAPPFEWATFRFSS